MKLLTASEADVLHKKQEHRQSIDNICRSYLSGMQDLLYNNGYKVEGKTEDEQIAYSLGWNRLAKMLYDGQTEKCFFIKNKR